MPMNPRGGVGWCTPPQKVVAKLLIGGDPEGLDPDTLGWKAPRACLMVPSLPAVSMA